LPGIPDKRIIIMRIIMMGTGPFAVPTYLQLYEAEHTVPLLVSRPLRSHRGKEIAPVSVMRDIAHEHQTPIFDPEDINTSESQDMLLSQSADLLVVCDYGQILSPTTLATAPLGGVNLHASLLPKYRGAAPINWAIYNGETETGVTAIHMTPRVDAGPCIGQASTEIEPNETAVEVEDRLAHLGAQLMRRLIDGFASGPLEALPQDQSLASKAPRLKKTDGAIDWTRPAIAIKNQIRALEPWPKTYTFWHRAQGESVRMIFGPSDVIPLPQGAAEPGVVVTARENRLEIATGAGALVPRQVQPAGKRAMTIDELLRGNRIQVGERFGPELAPDV
jgi:methionyl-tRNA formyltransferase